QGYAEAYKDVVHEDAIKVGGATKAPDYCFRVGGARKFFLEAKKPSINIKHDVHPAYQLRRYAWSAKLPLSILTDFEELAVYDCRIKPVKTDRPARARTLYLTFRDYPDRWDDIAGVFSRQAVLKGSFDKYVESHKAKRGTAEVDAAFLAEIERWRETLARNLALRNPNLSQRQLNFAVQRTIDRLIFLRIAEDRGLEPYGRLMALQNGGQVYPRLMQLFQVADDRYNAGLFHFKPEKGRPGESLDDLTPGLAVDDRVLKDILQNLYYPDSPYEFSVLPADILGQVYEQFLGQVIRLTPAHRAVVEAKPEVKKAGGVYYTPTYIVDYIVRGTVGALVEGKTPRQARNLRILDPACGSGSFLLGAYQFLLDWYLARYVEDDPARHARGRPPRLRQTGRGDWALTTAERKRILLDHIYGVDIDPQAVEVTKLSLLLKVLEGETEESIATQLSFFQERALPDLGRNIKCGNSLIGPDFYDGQQLRMGLLDEEEMYRLNVFDWAAEFP
ncbi:MAG: N-6 DNA methylase, partial [Anaerolineae bacterium]